MRYADTPYPPLVLSASGVSIRTKAGAWPDQVGYGTEAFSINTSGDIKVCTTTSQKIGFFGSTPVVQQTLSAAATDLASVIALTNSIRTAMINLGLAV